MQLIETKTLGTAASNIEFTDIPQNFTDIVFLYSLRTSTADADVTININSSSTGFTNRYLFGNGSSASSGTAYGNYVGAASHNSQTANTFSNMSLYFPNYTGSTNKSYSVDAVSENNATSAIQAIVAGLWSNTAAITSVKFLQPNAANFVAGSTISLYGIGGTGDGYAPKATGGSVSFANGYWVHTFTSSGTFTPTANLTDVECLVVAGGGGGGTGSPDYTYAGGGGGGAGGFRSFTGISLTSATNYTVTVGAGGAAGTSNGGNSVFDLYTSAGGGVGGNRNYVNPGSGGSGGGGGRGQGGGAGNTPSTSPSQGNNGGTGNNNGFGAGGGGGGASAVGQTAPNDGTAGSGGNGSSSSITGATVTYAGGGGGGSVNRGGGGTGGGGDGASAGNNQNSTAGATNTGGGGGAGDKYSGTVKNPSNGGSGIVIVRYAA